MTDLETRCKNGHWRTDDNTYVAHKQGEPMDSLDQKLAEARVSKLEWDDPEEQWHREWWWLGFDAAAQVAREVVAEKDAEIVTLKARANRLGEWYKLMAEDNAELHKRLREPRKVSDAQRRLDLRIFAGLNNVPQERVDEFCDLTQRAEVTT